ncbi:hypothetical protein BJ912DRAFT_120864 [Pholiota molesta]|nr:hypothetical protein BJ912DRAFT_120864 [Pholiota molesta]
MAKRKKGDAIQAAPAVVVIERQTRSGRAYCIWDAIIECPADFDYAALLQQSCACELEDLLDDDNEAHSPIAKGPSGPLNGTFDERTTASAPIISINAPCPLSHPESQPSSSRKRCNQELGQPTRLEQDVHESSHANRRRKRRRQDIKRQLGQLPTSTSGAHVASAAHMPLSLDCSKLPATVGAYGAKHSKLHDAETPYTKDQLINELGFTHVPWDGRKSMVAVDSQKRICMAFVGHPGDAAYLKSCDTVYDLMQQAKSKSNLAKCTKRHTRGRFTVLNAGVVHGKGTSYPMNRNNKEYNNLVAELLANSHLQRIASFASTSFAAYSKNLFSYYKEKLDSLFSNMPGLKRIFLPTSACIQVPPSTLVPMFRRSNVATSRTARLGGVPFQALGNFDPTKGGHLILWEARLVVEFPPGSLILIPSATITHSNTPVAAGDSRASFTQYAPGDLFRYVDYGFRLEKELKDEDPEHFERVMKERPDNWRAGLDLLQKVKDN